MPFSRSTRPRAGGQARTLRVGRAGQRGDADDSRRVWVGRASRLLIVAVMALVALGMVMLSSASSVRGEYLHKDPFFFVKRQGIWLGIGLVAALVASNIPYRFWKPTAWLMLGGTVALLVAVLVFGAEINGSRRWIFGFQPSETAKFSVVAALAAYYTGKPLHAREFRHGLVVPGLLLGGVALLILGEPDFGTTALVGGVGAILMLAGGAHKGWLAGAALAGMLLLVVYVSTDKHRWDRVMAWLDASSHPELSHQALQAERAFSLGGAEGVGLVDSLQKQRYLPEVHTDFIYAVVAEELGLAGSVGVLLLFAVFTLCGYGISCATSDQFGRLLSLGITLMIGLQALMNIAVVTGSVPTKGIALPFFSYGGTSLCMCLFEVGVLVNISGRTQSGEWVGSRRRRQHRLDE